MRTLRISLPLPFHYIFFSHEIIFRIDSIINVELICVYDLAMSICDTFLKILSVLIQTIFFKRFENRELFINAHAYVFIQGKSDLWALDKQKKNVRMMHWIESRWQSNKFHFYWTFQLTLFYFKFLLKNSCYFLVLLTYSLPKSTKNIFL